VINAFRHSGARNIEVEVEYASRRLRMLVRDNGRGIDPQTLTSGRDGHWGLPGMRERAERIGAKVRLWSRPGSGTEVELLVPSHVAFPSRSVDRTARLVSRPFLSGSASRMVSKFSDKRSDE
jgi:nitrate/nitrite-specific signal transduction histidine kinase